MAAKTAERSRAERSETVASELKRLQERQRQLSTQQKELAQVAASAKRELGLAVAAGKNGSAITARIREAEIESSGITEALSLLSTQITALQERGSESEKQGALAQDHQALAEYKEANDVVVAVMQNLWFQLQPSLTALTAARARFQEAKRSARQLRAIDSRDCPDPHFRIWGILPLLRNFSEK